MKHYTASSTMNQEIDLGPTVWEIQDEAFENTLITYSETLAKSTTHALNLIAFMQTHLPETYKRVTEFYQQYQDAAKIIIDHYTTEEPTLETRGEPTCADEDGCPATTATE